MSLCNWSCICLLGGLVLIGWPAAVCWESEEKHPPGVKECRVHIEKALEQYWDQKEPAENPSPFEDTNVNYLDESDSDQEKETIEKKLADSKDLGRQVDTDDNGDEEPNHQGDNNDNTETENNEQDSENVEEPEVDDNEDDEEDEDENGNENENEEDIVNEDEEDTVNEDEEDTENDDEDAANQDEATVNENKRNENETEEVNQNEDNEGTENEENEGIENVDEEGNEHEDEYNNHESEDDDENDEESENSNGDEQNNGETEHTESSLSSKQDNDVDTDQQEDDENDGNETNSKEESIEKEEIRANSDESQEDGDNEDEVDDDVEESENDGEDEQSEIESNLLDESSRNERVDISPEETNTEHVKATSEAEKETEEHASTEDTSEIENIYEEEEESEPASYRSREHIDVILGSGETSAEEERVAQGVLREVRRLETTHIKPVELLYKYADSTTRSLGDAEIFSKPMLLFLGPWGTGKTSIINYLLGLERTPSALKTGTGITDVDFTVLTYGTQRRIISGTELAADWHYAGVQKFGQGFLDHFRSIHIPHPLLQKVTIVDSPGIVENRKNTERGYSFNSAFQWFIDRADAVYVVLDPSKVDIGGELGSVIEQLQGQNVRFLLNKADSIRRSDLMRVVGQLFWNLSPLLGGAEAPLIYAVSLTSHPYHPSAPAKFLADQEKNFLYDMKTTLDKRVENKILYARKHAVRVRNHAKMVDCYLASYYRHKSIFSNKRNVAKLITENPREYNIYDGLTSMTNVSRSDVPNPVAYREFFKIHPLYDFKPLASTCSYFRGCPMDKVDLAITKEIPELLAKYKDAKRALYGQLEQDR